MFLFSPLISACYHFSFWNMGFYTQKGLFRLSSPRFSHFIEEKTEAGSRGRYSRVRVLSISPKDLAFCGQCEPCSHLKRIPHSQQTGNWLTAIMVLEQCEMKWLSRIPSRFFPCWDTNFIFHPFHLWCLRILLNLYHKRWDHLDVLLQITYCVLRSLLLEHQLI